MRLVAKWMCVPRLRPLRAIRPHASDRRNKPLGRTPERTTGRSQSNLPGNLVLVEQFDEIPIFYPLRTASAAGIQRGFFNDPRNGSLDGQNAMPDRLAILAVVEVPHPETKPDEEQADDQDQQSAPG